MIFRGLVVVQLDDEHDVAVQIKGKRIIINIIHANNVKNIVPALACSVQKCLTAAIQLSDADVTVKRFSFHLR